MNSSSGRAPTRSSARARSATNTAALLSSPTMTKSPGIAPAISAASASTRAAISAALNRTRIPSIPASPHSLGGASPSRRADSIVMGAAVDVDGLAGDEAAVVADQEQAGRRDLVDMSLPGERNAGGIRHAPLIPLGVVAPGIDAAGRDDVGSDVVTGE